jgi:6-phospho-beta-glucosidase
VHVTILGGGGFRVPLIARQLAASGLPVSRLVLYDTDPGRLAVIAGVLAGDPGLARLPVTVVTDLDAALRGAGVIFAALRPGGLDGRVGDERGALALGLLGQETVGAGGLASAARTVPAADAIARRVAELAPAAWVISMTNPAGIVTEVMTAALGARVIGVCDSPVGLIRRACAACGIDPGPSLGAVTDRVDADYLGINHLGWLRGLRLNAPGQRRGPDLLPGLLADPVRLRTTEEGRLFGADVLRSLGAIPNEYLYWYYGGREALRDVLAAGRTRGEHVRERQQAFYAAALPAAGGPAAAARLWQAANDERNRSYFAELRTGEHAGERDEADVAAGGYESVAVALASALAGGPAARLILNVPNGDTVPALPPDLVLEVPCRVDAGGPVPLPVSPPTAHQLGLMSVVRASERDIADATLLAASADGRGTAAADRARTAGEHAAALALRAFATHPLVGSLDAARVLAASALSTALQLTSPPSDQLSYRYSSFCIYSLAAQRFLQYSCYLSMNLLRVEVRMRGSSTRRILRPAGIAVACTLAAAAAACSSSSSSSGSAAASGTATVSYWTSGTQAEINYIDTQFDKAHPGIKAVGQYIASADQSTAKEVAAIKSGTEPDVVIGQDPSALPLLAESGKVVDLTAGLKTQTAELYPGIKAALFYKNQELGVALGGVGDYVLFYNKKDFAAAGISAPPKTWAQLETDAVKLSDPAKHHYGIYIPFGTDEWISYDWESVLWSNGGQLVNADGTKTAFNSPAGVAALTLWTNLVRKDHAAPTTSYAQAGSFDGAPAFASDAVSMIVEGQWALSEFKSVDYGVAELPAGSSGHSATGIGVAVASVFDHGSAQNNASVTFVQWLASPAQGAYLAATNSGLPSGPSQLSYPAVKKQEAAQPTYQVFASQLTTGQARPSIPAYTALSTALATEINAALTGGISPSAALAKAAAAGDQAIASGS